MLLGIDEKYETLSIYVGDLNETAYILVHS